LSPKRGGEPKRRVTGAAKRHSVLVFTEGKQTEPVYLTHWSRAYRDKIIVTIDAFHGTPLSLVQEAVARRATDLRAARRGGGDAYSEYWCVFDIDEHPNVARALELAAASGVSVSVTNPCIELWFLLHFQDQNAAIDRHEVQRKASDYLSGGKTPTSAALAALALHYEEARRRAQGLDRKHDLDGSPPRSNPSSEVWRLIDTIRRSG
jgi:RloB-like protein